jgi:hypothetical protein
MDADMWWGVLIGVVAWAVVIIGGCFGVIVVKKGK